MGNMCCANFHLHLRYVILYLEWGKGDGGGGVIRLISTSSAICNFIQWNLCPFTPYAILR